MYKIDFWDFYLFYLPLVIAVIGAAIAVITCWYNDRDPR